MGQPRRHARFTLRRIAGTLIAAALLSAIGTGSAGAADRGPKLTLTPAGGWEFGTVTIGETKTVALTVSNTGGCPMTIIKSRPPTDAHFTVLDTLDKATVIPAGESRTLRISFTPTDATTVTDRWTINAGDGSGAHVIAVTGTGVRPLPVEPTPVESAPPAPGPIVPDATFPPLGPEVNGLGRPELIVQKLRPDLSVTKAQLSRDGRKLVIGGRITAAAVGPLSVRISARVGGRTVTKRLSLRLRARPTYTITVVLQKAARAWTRLQVVARFPGNDRVWPGTGSLTLVRARYLGGA
ncbi:MAG TPA: hypothetical protein VFY45_13345 [Baekduia sp.]|nr:hypothetical protein [Baekduia sp.]